MGHKIILNKTAGAGETIGFGYEPATYTFEYEPAHDQTPAQAGEQFAKVQKFLEKAVNAANGEPTE